MATFYLVLDKTITGEIIRNKFRAFVELYGESEIYLKGDCEISEKCKRNAKIESAFGLNCKVWHIMEKTLDIDISEDDCDMFLPSGFPDMYGSSYTKMPELMFITKH